MSKRAYQVTEGKHDMGEAAGDDRYVRKGAIVDLEPAEAQRFPNKFKLYEAPAAVEAKPDAVEAKPDE